MALPVDLAIALARAGVPPEAPDGIRANLIRNAIADRGGYFAGPELAESGYRVELLSPQRETFEGRTEELALAWCLVFMLGETGELGIGGITA